MTSVDKIIGTLLKENETNPFKKTKTEIEKACNELEIAFEEITNNILELLKNGVISLKKYTKLKQDGKSDKEIIEQIEAEINLGENLIN